MNDPVNWTTEIGDQILQLVRVTHIQQMAGHIRVSTGGGTVASSGVDNPAGLQMTVYQTQADPSAGTDDQNTSHPPKGTGGNALGVIALETQLADREVETGAVCTKVLDGTCVPYRSDLCHLLLLRNGVGIGSMKNLNRNPSGVLSMVAGIVIGAITGLTIWLTTGLYVFFPVFLGIGFVLGMVFKEANERRKRT